jgi:hypothetical protein
MYTLKLTINFVAHLTFHVLKLKLFMCDDQKLNRKQKVWLDVHTIEHRFAIKINDILCAKETHMKGKSS